MIEFEVGKHGEEFIECKELFAKILERNEKDLGEIRNTLKKDMEEFHDRGFLTAAFIGEYSAGKSTIISALTGRDDIKISADIATDTTTAYEWNAIHLIDTPGLFTERKNHDEITLKAIKKADLLIYCLTYSLFDSVTAKDFKKLAFEQNYRQKMILAINKMSNEAGDDEQRMNAYRESIKKALNPFEIDEFTVNYIDALDYMDGKQEDNRELIELSRFELFIDSLNTFIREKGTFGRLDTPVRILSGFLDDASLKLARSDVEDTAFLELLNRMSKAVEQERRQLRTDINAISTELSSKIVDQSAEFTQNIDAKEEIFTKLCKQAEAKIKEESEKASKQMEMAINDAIQKVREKVSEIITSPLAQSYIVSLKMKSSVDSKPSQCSDSLAQISAKLASFNKIAENVGLTIAREALGKSANAAEQAAGVFLRSSQVAGSTLHNSVYAVGKFIGYDFKPWQAVNMAKDIANVVKFAGPIIAVLAIGADIASECQSAENEQKRSDARREIDSKFVAIAEEFDKQFKQELQKVEEDLFDKVKQSIDEANDRELETIAAANKDIGEIQAINTRLKRLIVDLKDLVKTKETASTVKT